MFSHVNTNDPKLWIGHGFRTDALGHDEVCDFFGMKNNLIWDEKLQIFENLENEEGVNAYPLRLVLPEFYHLDSK